MSNPTPLQVWVAVLGGSPDADAHVLKRQAKRLAQSRRDREIAEYLIAAVEGKLPRRQKAGGSLKHILWWLRVHAGDVYEPAARAVLNEARRGTWPLSNTLPNVSHLPILGAFLQDLQAPVDWRALAKQSLVERRIGGLLVAVNTTALNMTGPAMRLGYDVMVARSSVGAAVKTRRGLVVDVTALPASVYWAQPYPDLAVWRGEPSRAPTVEALLNALPGAVKEVK